MQSWIQDLYLYLAGFTVLEILFLYVTINKTYPNHRPTLQLTATPIFQLCSGQKLRSHSSCHNPFPHQEIGRLFSALSATIIACIDYCPLAFAVLLPSFHSLHRYTHSHFPANTLDFLVLLSFHHTQQSYILVQCNSPPTLH